MQGGLPGRGARRVAARGSLAVALALLLAAPGCGERSAPPSGPTNVVLITLDTTRPDHLGLYGYARPTSPSLDQLASESLVYERAYSTSSWTLPAHASLFTGMFPTSHGADKDPEGEFVLSDEVETPESWQIYRASAPRDDVPTLAGILREQGYATGAVVGGPWMKRVFGLAAGFDFYDDENVDADGRPADELTSRAKAWLREQRTPFFLFLNYFDPHTPYTEPRNYARMVLGDERFPSQPTPEQVQVLRYDAEIRFMDDQIGLLLAELRRLGFYDTSWIVVTADHGELLGEHGRVGHGLTLDEELVRVPLLVKPPKGRGEIGRSQEPVQLTDVLPMLLAAFELPRPDTVQGRAPGEREAPILAEVRPLPAESTDGDYRAWIEGDWKLVWNSQGRHALFDLGSDPRCEHDLSAAEPERVAAMTERLERTVAGLPRPPRRSGERRLDPDTVEALRGLGYVE